MAAVSNGRGGQYALALLARGTAADWDKLSRTERDDMAADVFDLVDQDGNGSIDKWELYTYLAHGSVSLPHRVVESLFENMDVNGDGNITEDEWCDNFGYYIEDIVKSAQAAAPTPPRQLAPIQHPKAPAVDPIADSSLPALRPSSRDKVPGQMSGMSPTPPNGVTRTPQILPNGIRGKAGQTTSARTLMSNSPHSGMTKPSTISSRFQLTRSKPVKSVRNLSDTVAEYAAISFEVEHSSASAPTITAAGGRRPSVIIPSSPGSNATERRRMSSTGPPSVCSSSTSASSSPSTITRPLGSPAAKQSDRSVVKKGKKTAHFVIGHYALNNRAKHDIFKARLIRRKSLKALLTVFKGINVTDSGKITRNEFESYLRWKAPELIAHARGIYKACMVRSKGKNSCDEEELDFRTLLRIMYPGATNDDINELLNLTKPRDKPADWTAKKSEAKDLFNLYNTTRDGWLTPEEFHVGMSVIGMAEDDIDFHFDELFPDHRTEPVNFATFFLWYTGHPLPDEFEADSQW